MLARSNPFNPDAVGAKLVDFDMSYSATARSEQEYTGPATAVSYWSGFIQPGSGFSGGNTGTAAFITTDLAGSTSSDTVTDFSKVTYSQLDEFATGGIMNATTGSSSFRPVGYGAIFEYRGADASASGELIIAPYPDNDWKNYVFGSSSSMNVARMKKIPGAQVVPISQLKIAGAVFRGVPLDLSYSNYVASTNNGAICGGWTGCLFAVAGGPATLSNWLKVTLVYHWEFIPIPSQIAIASKAAHFNTDAIADQHEFDHDLTTQTAILPYDLIEAGQSFLMGAARRSSRAFVSGVTDYLRDTLLHGSVGSSTLDYAMTRLALGN